MLRDKLFRKISPLSLAGIKTTMYFFVPSIVYVVYKLVTESCY